MALSKVNPNFVNQLGRRNLIINGDFMVAQRGTSQTSSGYGSVDRWYLYSSGGTYSQSTSSPPDGFSHYLTCTGATGSVIFAQGIELPATGKAGVFYNGQTITVSYYAKSTVAGDALYNPLSFRNSQTSITNLVNIDNDSSDNNILTTSWAKYSKTYTIGVSAHANNICLVVQPRTSGAPSGNISITGVQLEVGDTATPFEHRSYGEELAACQRYYQLNIANTGFTNTTTVCRLGISGVTSMRAQPSISIVSATGVVEDFGIANRNLVSLGGLSGGAGGTFFLGGAVDATITSSSSGRSHLLFPGAIAMAAEL
jgi:hypothetical protein